ncbi:hypothetical protein [Streptomyces osmaniensis]|uniref:Uncharacterized protein n=1 Tax=Streptomyces osmaniensis TaxID=593134 RepID=A0ABP6V5A8_9ACTN|nr:hypothetical protein KJK32_16700 [Streptomyces sp. JCM17656]
MPAAPRAFEGLAERIRRAADVATVDMLLDRWLDYRDRATEWDAHRWGLDDLDRKTEPDRLELIRRARLSAGAIPMDDEGIKL